jgi:hypothetical protein
MTPELIAAGITILQQIIQAEPGIAADIKALFAGGVPTDASWAALQASIQSETYGEFVPASDLPASKTGV